MFVTTETSTIKQHELFEPLQLPHLWKAPEAPSIPEAPSVLAEDEAEMTWSCVECRVPLPWGTDWRQEGEDFYCH